jgi:hypothetical protein
VLHDHPGRRRPRRRRIRRYTPVLDGVARLGVLAVTVDEYDDATQLQLRQYSSWLALLLLTITTTPTTTAGSPTASRSRLPRRCSGSCCRP